MKEFHIGSSGHPTSVYSNQMERGYGFNQKAQRKMKTSWKRAYEQPKKFFTWFAYPGDASSDDIAEVIKGMWPNPLQYFLVPDIEVENKLERKENKRKDDQIDESGSCS